jgi:LuxR family transcriptional regulator, maltose regulon positive regulatory protein
MIDDLLRTKLMPPRLPGGLVVGTSLPERLNVGLEKKLTLVSAPTGFGKSTLVGLWLGQRPVPCAWLTLDAGDNDPARSPFYLVPVSWELLPPGVRLSARIELDRDYPN